MIRAVIDTNVLVSSFISPLGPPGRILVCWETAVFSGIASPQLLDEYLRVLSSPRIAQKYGIGQSTIDLFVTFLKGFAEPVSLATIPDIVRDPGDNVVLATAVVGNAGYIVTGDKPLLALESHHGIRIVQPPLFEALLLAS
ncbi:MAG: putative toxin-antitoxin system toxin component, PIN family [Dehalococcoidia bacterium]|nr:putative toxin-antitoxin system toxin component, PIN family [Dehalococcoidia bacterium]